MSHYHTMVLVNPEVKDVRAEVARLLAPFDEKLEVEPYEVKVDEASLEAMIKHYNTEDLLELSDKMQGWDGKDGFVKEGNLYYLTTYNPNSKWDWYRIGGRWDGILYGARRISNRGYNTSENHETLEYNVRLAAELPPVEDLDCYAVLTSDGRWHAHGIMGGWGVSTDEIAKTEWNGKVKRLLDEYKTFMAVCVDCHI